MKSEKELNKEILSVTLEIRDKFPELAKKITEIPQHSPTNSPGELKRKDLKEYLDSLNQIIESYGKENQV